MFHLIAGISSEGKTVSLFHTNKNLRIFDSSIEDGLKRIYDQWPSGTFLFPAGLQDGYDEIGLALLIIK